MDYKTLLHNFKFQIPQLNFKYRKVRIIFRSLDYAIKPTGPEHVGQDSSYTSNVMCCPVTPEWV